MCPERNAVGPFCSRGAATVECAHVNTLQDVLETATGPECHGLNADRHKQVPTRDSSLQESHVLPVVFLIQFEVLDVT